MPVLIFLPQWLLKEDNCFLRGSFHMSERNVVSFYIIKPRTKSENADGLVNIGQLINNNNLTFKLYRESTANWVFIENKANGPFLKKLVLQGKAIDIDPQNIIFILYDLSIHLNTDSWFTSSSNNFIEEDCFQVLLNNIRRSNMMENQHEYKEIKTKSLSFLTYLITYLNIVLSAFSLLLPIFKFSSLCIRVHSLLEGIKWALKSYETHKVLNLKIGNFVFASIVDVVCGYVVLHWFMLFVSSTLPSHLLLHSAENVVQTLQELLKWLMGIPAGLKLNFAFNNMLGKFFMYHINLWWTFLVITEPVLDFIFTIFLCFGRLGLSFQAAILADLLALASFHVYCIYVYAARLYNLQISGLLALWRLFLGRKKNPLRERVDSCEYTANQLFIGTLAFTILLFLLPTTFMYYIVFATLRLLVAALAGLLIRIQFLLQALPVYATLMWFLNSTSVNSSIRIQTIRRITGFPMILSVIPVRGSLWNIIQRSVPYPVKNPSSILWSSILKNIVTGQLIYPM